MAYINANRRKECDCNTANKVGFKSKGSRWDLSDSFMLIKGESFSEPAIVTYSSVSKDKALKYTKDKP